MTELLKAIPNLQPYGNPQYFVYLIVALLPVIVALLMGKRLKIYEALVSLAFVLLMFTGTHWPQLLAMIGYILWQIVIIYFYAHYRKHHDTPWMFGLVIFLDILPIIIVKLTPAIDPGHNSLLGFLGISYMMFKSIGMLIDLRDATLNDFTLSEVLRFILFMPTLSSGPIDRFKRFTTNFKAIPDRDQYLKLLDNAVKSLFQGFLYKFILAYIFGTLLLPHLERRAIIIGGLFNWPTFGVMYVYGLYLFFDFAGYSLFAIAISNIMGIETPINFNKPFIAKNLKDFWNRWHMTLSFWFRDYIFMRVVMTLMRRKVFKNRNVTSSVAYMINMTIMGLWHGVTWFYITYGLFHGLALVINDWWLRYKKRSPIDFPSNKWTNALAIFVTFNTVLFSFLIFSGFLNQLWFHAIN